VVVEMPSAEFLSSYDKDCWHTWPKVTISWCDISMSWGRNVWYFSNETFDCLELVGLFFLLQNQ